MVMCYYGRKYVELLFYRNFSDSNLIQIGKSTNLWDWSKGKVKH